MDMGKQKLKCPFVNECRAFARLHDLGYDGLWAVKCYGWTELTDSQLQKCYELANLTGKHCTRLAIVKDFIAEENHPEHIPEICRRFEIAKSAQILPRDIDKRNYKGRLIVDLGSSMTSPLYKQVQFDWFYERCEGIVANWWKSSIHYRFQRNEVNVHPST